MIPQNGSKVAVAELLGGTATDGKNKALKFEQDKDRSIPSFLAKGKSETGSKRLYGFDLTDVLVTVTVSEEPNLKALRRKGFPVDKNEAKKLDAEIKEEDKAAGIAAGTEEEETEDANPTLKAEEKSGGRRAR